LAVIAITLIRGAGMSSNPHQEFAISAIIDFKANPQNYLKHHRMMLAKRPATSAKPSRKRSLA